MCRSRAYRWVARVSFVRLVALARLVYYTSWFLSFPSYHRFACVYIYLVVPVWTGSLSGLYRIAALWSSIVFVPTDYLSVIELVLTVHCSVLSVILFYYIFHS